MPQGPVQTNTALAAGSTAAKPLNLTAQGELFVMNGGTSAAYNITAATVVKATPGTLHKIVVLVAGAAGTANNCITTGAVAAANEIFVIPATVGVYTLDWPCSAGITIAPGASQVVTVSYT